MSYGIERQLKAVRRELQYAENRKKEDHKKWAREMEPLKKQSLASARLYWVGYISALTSLLIEIDDNFVYWFQGGQTYYYFADEVEEERENLM